MGKINYWNPFERIAGTEAFLWGIAILLLAAFIGSFGNIHFDGIMDIHVGKEMPLWFFIAESLISWLSISLLLLIASFIFSPTKFRVLDIFGTQAFARILLIPIAIFGACFPQTDASNYFLYETAHIGKTVSVSTFQLISFGVFITISIITIIWMTIWMFNAYKVSSNLKGSKAIVSFIIALFIAEVLSKSIIYLLTI